MSVILIFVDGIGIGQNDPSINPCLHSEYKIFSPKNRLPHKGVSFPLDACLGIIGFPQSATGQTTIYTGVNAAKHIGKHLFGFPNAQLIELLVKNSIFVNLISSGYGCKFINAFRPVFFTSPELFKKIRLSVTSEMNKAAGLDFNTLYDVKKGKALYHDFTNHETIKKGFKLPVFDPDIASNILINQSKEFDLILYEYFMTDIAGHSKNINYAISELNKIESLIYNVVKKIQGTDISLLVCSDHGNIENIKTKSHTTNPAYFAIWTKEKIQNLSSLVDIKSLLLELVKKRKPIRERI